MHKTRIVVRFVSKIAIASLTLVGLVTMTGATLEWLEKRDKEDEWAGYREAEAEFIAANS